VGKRKHRIDFQQEVERHFEFLVEEFGFGPPIGGEGVSNSRYVHYEREGMGYDVGYSSLDDVVTVLVLKERDNDQDGFRVHIEEVVKRAGLGQERDVQMDARSDEKMRKSLESLAYWVRRVHPLVVGPDGDSLLKSPNWPPP
jgi:hypothetical protein